MLRLDPRNAAALAFLGMVLHMVDEIDAAIVKYHEVSLILTPAFPLPAVFPALPTPLRLYAILRDVSSRSDDISIPLVSRC